MPATRRGTHLARPGRPVVVARTLAELTGPTGGVVELPVRLMWSSERTFDLADPDDLLWMYENVLRETTRADELRALTRRAHPAPGVAAVEPAPGVRQAWEGRHRGLRPA